MQSKGTKVSPRLSLNFGLNLSFHPQVLNQETAITVRRDRIIHPLNGCHAFHIHIDPTESPLHLRLRLSYSRITAAPHHHVFGMPSHSHSSNTHRNWQSADQLIPLFASSILYILIIVNYAFLFIYWFHPKSSVSSYWFSPMSSRHNTFLMVIKTIFRSSQNEKWSTYQTSYSNFCYTCKYCVRLPAPIR